MYISKEISDRERALWAAERDALNAAHVEAVTEACLRGEEAASHRARQHAGELENKVSPCCSTVLDTTCNVRASASILIILVIGNARIMRMLVMCMLVFVLCMPMLVLC